jgi:iron complex outermembrane receptor protein/vitamin B12 transporter
MKCHRLILSALFVIALASVAWAQGPASLTGTVVDPLGDAVPGAAVTLLRDGQQVATATTSTAGEFSFANLTADRYQVRVELSGFETRTTDAVFVDGSTRAPLIVGLSLGALRQNVVVTAAAAEQLESQTGAPVTVIDAGTIEALNKPDMLEALRLVPGAQVVQTGARGGGASFFVRGGDSDFNKVLIDGLPVNDIGGGFDFSQVASSGLERIEVLRQSNSVIYGSDALSGVVSMDTRRGRTRLPELMLALDGGNLGTINTDAGVGGARGRLDYFGQFTHFETDNDVANNDFQRRMFAGRVGVALGRGSDLSATVRRSDSEFGSPNGLLLYGRPDDSRQDGEQTYFTLSSQSQWSSRWQSVVRFGISDQRSVFTNPTASGEAFDPFGFGANYLGNTVTLTAADGQQVTGRAILDFGGTFPSVFRSRTTRRILSGQATYQATPMLAISGGGRIEREAGYNDPDGDPSATRVNGGMFVEGRASFTRTYVSAGLGYERNEVFESAVSPRVSVAVYLREPVPGAPLGDTKFVLNAGSGIKAPAVFQEQSSLAALVPTAEAIGPERSRNFDIGVEQGLAGGSARVRAAYFDNDFHDLIEFVSKNVLPQVGVPPAVAAATAFGAYVNSQSFRARGLELALEAQATTELRVNVSYTYLDAEVSESFSGGALAPATNPAFPGVQIGAFSPLIGARPFRRPTHSGNVFLAYTRGPAQVSFSGYFAGARDDSTFLSDGFFGNSLLLPNEDLAPSYQKFDLAGSYWVHPRVKGYVSIENLFDEDYQASFGFPSLPRTARIGVSVRLGGD